MTGILLALAAALTTAFSHVLAKDSLHKQDFLAFLTVRTVSATLALALAIVLRGGGADIAAIPTKLKLVILGVGLMVPLTSNVLYFRALRRMPVNVTMPLFQSYPAMSFVLGALLLGSRVGPATSIAVAVVVAGNMGFCMSRRNGGTVGRIGAYGVTLTFAAALLMAGTTIVWKLLQTQMSPTAIAFLGTGSASAVLAVISAVRWRKLHWGPLEANLKTALSGILVFSVANVMSITALRNMSPGVVYPLVASSVIWVGILARFMLRERWTRLQLVSAICVFVGIALLSFVRG